MATKTVTILTDSREKQPLLFPGCLVVHTRSSWWGRAEPTFIKVKTPKPVALPAGDYCIKGKQDRCIIETKRSIDELAGNVSAADRKRFTAALNRLCDACEHPILMLDFLPLAIWQSKNPNSRTDPIHALDVVLDIVAERGIQLVWGSQRGGSLQARRRLGEIVLRLLLHHSGVL